jgi:hypothetical protein
VSRNLIALFVSLALASAFGCAISESISNSISSPFKSSSKSSSPDDEGPSEEHKQQEAKLSYSDDVRQLAETYTRSGGEIGALRSHVSKLASARGITNWETDSVTCTSLAEGARSGGMTPEQQITFSNEICPPQ